MRSVASIILLAGVIANCSGDTHDSRDTLLDLLLDDNIHMVDKLEERRAAASPAQQTNVDNTLLGKPAGKGQPTLRRTGPAHGQASGVADGSIDFFRNFFPIPILQQKPVPTPSGTSVPANIPSIPRSSSRVIAHAGVAKEERKVCQDLENFIRKLPPTPFKPTLVGSYSYHGLDGRAKINQDMGCVAYPFGGNSQQALFAVFDGHGEAGEKVSQFARSELQDSLEKYPDLVGNEVNALETSFKSVDQQLPDKLDPLYSGSTAVAALLRGNQLWVANAGDSRCILASRSKEGGDKIVTQDLSKDHNPDTPGEKERIEKSGGFVSPPPEPGLSARVWLDKQMTQVGLAMARSIGDHAVKKVGVIATPEVKAYELNSNSDDLFLILATDGIWEFISSQEAAEIVWGVLQSGGGASKATQMLMERAALEWRREEGDYRDDITCIVVALPLFGQAPAPPVGPSDIFSAIRPRASIGAGA